MTSCLVAPDIDTSCWKRGYEWTTLHCLDGHHWTPSPPLEALGIHLLDFFGGYPRVVKFAFQIASSFVGWRAGRPDDPLPKQEHRT